MDFTDLYVIQEEIPLEEKAAYQPEWLPMRVPDTVFIPCPRDMRELKLLHVPREVLLKNAVPNHPKYGPYVGKQYLLLGTYSNPYYWGIEKDGKIVPLVNEDGEKVVATYKPPEELILKHGFAEGDKVTLAIDHTNRMVFVWAMNGKQGLDIFWPDVSLEFLDPDYPHEGFDLEEWYEWKNPALRELFCPDGQDDITLSTIFRLAPPGKGHLGFNIAPGKSGKTGFFMRFFAALLQKTLKDPKLFVVMLLLGERGVDAGKDSYRGVYEITPHDPDRVEYFYASGIVRSELQWSVFKFVNARITRLSVEFDATLLGDSLSRAVEAADHGDVFPESAWTSKGLNKKALAETIEFALYTGNLEGRGSASKFYTLLGGSDDKVRKAIEQVAVETEDDVPFWVAKFFRRPGRRHPWPDMDDESVYVRRMELHTRPAQRRERALMLAVRWLKDETSRATRKADRAYETTLDLITNNRTPLHMLPEKPDDLLRVEERIECAAERLSKKDDEGEVVPKTKLHRDDIIEAAVRLWFDLVDGVDILIKWQDESKKPVILEKPVFNGEKFQDYLSYELSPKLDTRLWKFSAEQGEYPDYLVYQVVKHFLCIVEQLTEEEDRISMLQAGKYKPWPIK